MPAGPMPGSTSLSSAAIAAACGADAEVPKNGVTKLTPVTEVPSVAVVFGLRRTSGAATPAGVKKSATDRAS